jgi:hypothetical protein
MDKINFLLKDNFPLSSDTLDLMQRMNALIAGLAALGGDKYILSGCEDDGAGNVSNGVIVADGNILPLQGGIKKAKITIVETSKTLSAFGVDYPEAYVYRSAKFADAGEWDWADFARVYTNRELAQRITDFTEPIGSVKIWAGTLENIPTGYRHCNGDPLSRVEYPELFAAIGTSYDADMAYPLFRLPQMFECIIAGANTWPPSGLPDFGRGKRKTYGTVPVTSTIDGDPAIELRQLSMLYIIKVK